MYLDRFGLTEKPFEQTPDSRFLYLSEQHGYALASVKFAVASRDPFVVITGEVGSGKTTLLNRALSEFDDGIVAARLSHTRLTGVELLQLVLVELGVESFRMGKAELVTTLRRVVEGHAADGRHVVIAIDEAQNLSADALEELRLLTCIETERSKLLTVVLLGQPQLVDLLNSAGLEQLRQRCRLRIHIDELTAEEVGSYLRHRMSVAGGHYSHAFAPGVESLVHELSGGVPRLINLLCDTALTACTVDEHPQVNADVLAEVTRELGWAERTGVRVDPRPAADAPPAGAGAAFPRLRVTHRGQAVPDFVLGAKRNLLGRDPQCAVPLESKFASRRHAVIAWEDDAWVLVDLNSTNGTVVNGRRVARHRLADGDVITIGKYRLVFAAGHEASAGTGSPADSSAHPRPALGRFGLADRG